MADNCYCSVTFKTGEELDKALLNAKTACDESAKAVAAKESIENMSLVGVLLPSGATPSVTKTVENGVVTLTFGLVPSGDNTETWTFELENGSIVTKEIVVK